VRISRNDLEKSFRIQRPRVLRYHERPGVLSCCRASGLASGWPRAHLPIHSPRLEPQSTVLGPRLLWQPVPCSGRFGVPLPEWRASRSCRRLLAVWHSHLRAERPSTCTSMLQHGDIGRISVSYVVRLYRLHHLTVAPLPFARGIPILLRCLLPRLRRLSRSRNRSTLGPATRFSGFGDSAAWSCQLRMLQRRHLFVKISLRGLHTYRRLQIFNRSRCDVLPFDTFRLGLQQNRIPIPRRLNPQSEGDAGGSGRRLKTPSNSTGRSRKSWPCCRLSSSPASLCALSFCLHPYF
jgi:hypothetical protein